MQKLEEEIKEEVNSKDDDFEKMSREELINTIKKLKTKIKIQDKLNKKIKKSDNKTEKLEQFKYKTYALKLAYIGINYQGIEM